MADAKEIKRIDIKEFREQGFLQEANRLFFHPLGLALEIVQEDDGSECLGGVWDYRNDPEGMLFGNKSMNKPEFKEKAQRVEELRKSKLNARFETGECYENGIQKMLPEEKEENVNG